MYDIEVYADAQEAHEAAQQTYAQWLEGQEDATARLQAAQVELEAIKAQRLEQYGTLFSPEEQAEIEAWLF